MREPRAKPAVAQSPASGDSAEHNLFAWYARATGEADQTALLQQQLTEARIEAEKLRIENATLRESLKLVGGNGG